MMTTTDLRLRQAKEIRIVRRPRRSARPSPELVVKKKYIVLCPQFENCKNVLFLMPEDDSRFGTPNYQLVTPGKWTSERRTATNGHRVRVFAGDNGKRYLVFVDYSAKEE